MRIFLHKINPMKILCFLLIYFMTLSYLNLSDMQITVKADESIFRTYNLTDTELKKIASLCQQEQGTAKGAAAEASLMANLYEEKGYKSYSTLYDYVRKSGWWASATSHMDKMNATSSVIAEVRSVLIDGKRTIPGYIDEHDYIGDIKSCSNNGVSFAKKDKSKYIQFTTIIKNSMGATYTYYCHPDTSSDPFGYTSESRRKSIGERYYDFYTKELIGEPIPNKKWYDDMTPVNIGDCFTAYIINTASWKHLTSEDNDNVMMTSETRKAEQMWQFTRKSNGSYKIINCKTGKALDAGGTNSNLYTYEYCDNSWQSWYIYGSSGAYYLKSQESDYVVDIVGGFTDDGTNAQIYKYNGTDAQKFQIYMLDSFGNLGTIQNLGDRFTAYIINTAPWKHLTAEDNDNVMMTSETRKAEQMWQFTQKSDGSYKIINCKTGKALDAGGLNDNLYTYESCDNSWQSWYIFGSSGSYILKSQGSNNVIDIVGGYTDDGTNAQMYETNGTAAQKFQIYMLDEKGNLGTIQNLGDKFTAYIINLGAAKNLSVEDSGNVIIKTETGKAEQMWQFIRKSDGSYTILNCKTEQALDAGGADGNLYTYKLCDNDWQSWYIFEDSGSYFLKSQGANEVIDISGGCVDNGTNVQIYKCNSTDAQKFQIYMLDETGSLGVIQNLGDDFTAYITNVNSSKNLAIEYKNNVVIRKETKNAEQIWRFIRKSDGSYTIINCKTGKVLDSGGTDGNLYTYESCDNDWQSWYIFGNAGAYYLKSERFNDVIDVTGGYTDDGTNAQMYNFNNTEAQKFNIKETILFGDVNNDKHVNIADAIMLQNWLLGIGNLTNWKCVDLYEDGKIDVFDMIEMRKLIINSLSAQ